MHPGYAGRRSVEHYEGIWQIVSLVVSDAGPLHYLVLCHAVDCLPKLYGDIVAPQAVIDELTAPNTPAEVAAWVNNRPAWLRVVSPAANLTSSVLGKGESQAIALAEELRAHAVLIDERVGRRIARDRGIVVIGTIGILEDAARQNLIDLRPALEPLTTTNMRVTPGMIPGLKPRRLRSQRRHESVPRFRCSPRLVAAR
jgi:predicted nucleic acid-binding protein